MGYSRFKDPFILQILAKVYATKDRNSALALLTNVDIKPDKTPLKQDSYLFDDTGIAILRSGDNTLVFRYGFSDGSEELKQQESYCRSIPIKTGELLPLYWIIMVIPG